MDGLLELWPREIEAGRPGRRGVVSLWPLLFAWCYRYGLAEVDSRLACTAAYNAVGRDSAAIRRPRGAVLFALPSRGRPLRLTLRDAGHSRRAHARRPVRRARGTPVTGILGRGANAKQQNVAASLRFQSSQQGSVLSRLSMAPRGSRSICSTIRISTRSASRAAVRARVAAAARPAAASRGRARLYQVDFAAGVCQGPIANWGLLWYNKTVTTVEGSHFRSPARRPGDSNRRQFSALFLAADGQATDAYWDSQLSQ